MMIVEQNNVIELKLYESIEIYQKLFGIPSGIF